MKLNLQIIQADFSLADFLEREAGHVVVSMAALAVACVMWKFGIPHAEGLAGAAGGWLGRSMGSK
ncbi:MAG: hypothetical protein KGL39_51185 [Patescibacteria group bacterium]|nr:hypothetical protein [Patescibacteria group bacterium]